MEAMPCRELGLGGDWELSGEDAVDGHPADLVGRVFGEPEVTVGTARDVPRAGERRGDGVLDDRRSGSGGLSSQ
jgi:hypothetical protein